MAVLWMIVATDTSGIDILPSDYDDIPVNVGPGVYDKGFMPACGREYTVYACILSETDDARIACSLQNTGTGPNKPFTEGDF